MSSGSFISLLMAGLDCLFRFASSSDATSNSAMNCSTIRPISARGRSFFFFFLLLKSRSISSSSSASSAYNKNKNFTSCLHKQETNIGSIQYSLMTHMKCKACHFYWEEGKESASSRRPLYCLKLLLHIYSPGLCHYISGQ
jgi:hypothetical protein